MKNVPDQSVQKLMMDGLVCPENDRGASCKVSRGMAVLAREGIVVGKVAAVVLDGNRGQVTHLLLGRLPEMHGYWLIALDQIARVDAEAVHLSITAGVAAALPVWSAASP